MSSENKMWDEAKSQYLHQVEKVLASVKNSHKKEVLDDVRSHLERRFGELRPEQQSWENIQKIITDMGPPTDYAELMDTEQKPEKEKLSVSFVGAAIIIFAILAGLMIIFPLIYHPEEEEYELQETGSGTLAHPFSNDPEILGEWESVDFVEFVNDFQPETRRWSGELFLKGLTFMAEGRTSKSWTWSKGWIYDNDDNIKAEYKIRELAGQTYLFFPWLSGDVTIRGMKPKYYVLKKVSAEETNPEEEEYTLRESSVNVLPHSFTNDPEILGEWESVDFVEFVNDFQPEMRGWDGELFLKRIIFMAEGRTSKSWTWSKGWIHDNDDNIKAEYKIREIAGHTYLFFPWLSGDVTIRGMKPSYYVLKKSVDKQVFEITDFDAAVQDFNIMPDDEGDLYNAIVTIVNKGTKTLPEFRLKFYRGEPAENLNLYGKSQTGSHGAGPIEPDEVWRASSMPFALNEGLNVLSVVLDIDNTVKEVDEGNNSAELKILVENGKIIELSSFH